MGDNNNVVETGSLRTAVVTGGTSGIGLAIVERLVTLGYRVYFCARSTESVREVEDRFRNEGASIEGSTVDVANSTDIDSWVASISEKEEAIAAVINNAGTNGGGELSDISDEAWNRILSTNLNSVFYLTRALSRASLIPDFGRIVNVASTAGKQGIAFATPYSASKHAVIGFTKSLAKEVAPRGITVNAVCPGYVETPMAQRVREGYAKHYKKTESEILEAFSSKIPMGRYSTPEEVAGMVTYLLSDDAASITGQALNVCGGLGNY
ncbi:SDR family NAD(P)-dependent oxidoreductase [Glutamicibacter endophyticus]|uniref:SDR family NAD(P)-dependent oxidoreductase n=1 Tax=Glutamicibacter endophyticus TaxID=1522174 RepID=UPI003AEF2394